MLPSNAGSYSRHIWSLAWTLKEWDSVKCTSAQDINQWGYKTEMDLLIGYCLMSSEQYFSYIQGETKFNNI
jgi:hypothetical protein